MATGAARLRVLMIEDNPGDARLVREAMGSGGDVDIAHKHSLSTGLDALGGTSFDAVLLDLSLPDSHGLETVKRLRAAAPRVPIVVMTSLDNEQTALDAMAEGAQDYLVKGLDGEPRTITRALRYAIQRQHWQEQCAEVRKLEAMGRLAGAAAHEYNTLLTTILGCSELLLEGAEDRPHLRELAANIRTAAHRAATVTEQVLEVGGRKRLLSCGLSLNGAVRAAEATLREIVGERGRVRTSLDAAFDAVMFDAGEVEHILSVLAAAVLELAPGTSFDVETNNRWLDDTTARRMALTPGLHVVLRVRISGRGISHESFAAMLEPSAKPASASPRVTGLSLAGVDGTLRAAGARIHVETIGAAREPAFTMYFPHRSQRVEERPS